MHDSVGNLSQKKMVLNKIARWVFSVESEKKLQFIEG